MRVEAEAAPKQLLWEESACAGCGSSKSEFVFEGPDRLEGLPGCFRVVQCSDCGLYRQNPRLQWEALSAYYPDNYVSHPLLVKHQPSLLKRLDKRYGPWKRLRAVEKVQPGGRLLEIGCGTGNFLEEVIRSGKWEAVGVEPSQRAAEYVRDNLNIPVYGVPFQEVDLPPQTFDVVVMWNVLEHLYDPALAVRRVNSLLKNGGWFVFSIPNLESLEASLFGRYWVGWDLPRHLYLFPRKRLFGMLAEAGFERFSTRCISTSYSMLGHSLDFWSQSWAKDQPRLRKIMLNLYASLPGRLLAAPPLWVLDRLKKSTILTIFAQKHAE